MARYPFDTQLCTMLLEMEGNSGEFVKLVPESLAYLGPKDLTQYFIRWSHGFSQFFLYMLFSFQPALSGKLPLIWETLGGWR